MKKDIDIAIFGIDDDGNAVELLQRLLDIHGIKNYTLFTKPEDLLKALHKDVHICIIDYYLKNLTYSGITLIEEIVKSNPYCFFIMISAQTDMQVVIDFTNKQFGGRYIQKGREHTSELIIQYIKELSEHIQYLHGFYNHISCIKGKLSEMKELIAS